MPLHLTLFGALTATDMAHDRPCHFPTNKAKALLAYLAVESDQPHSRLTVASLLWSDVPEKTALTSLRQTLHRLRKSLETQIGPEAAAYVVSSRLSIHGQVNQGQVNQSDGGWWSDAPAFAALIDATRGHDHSNIRTCADCQAKLASAVALYQGDLLAGFHLKGADLYEEWKMVARERFRQQVMHALHDLLAGHFQRGDYAQVINHARRAIQLEPLSEIGWRYLMQALAASGRRHAALAEYERCHQLFATELAVVPSAELTALYAQLQTETAMPALSTVNPYKGLHTFTEADAPYFFGREETVAQLITKLETLRFVAVVAPSGGGKSSVVKAGLAPRLRRKGWHIGVCRPGDHPGENLANAIARLEEAPSGPALLVVDQFEELFASAISPDERQQFLARLLAPHATRAVVITLRADFMGHAIEHRALADALQTGALLLGPMNRDELKRAIIEPARGQGVMFEDGLVARLLHDVGTEVGQLPLLQFTLLQLWENRAARRLTHIAYESIGRLDGALSNYADSVYADLPTPEQVEARAIFLRMVQIDQNVQDMRRPLSHADLTATQWSIVGKLADARLLVMGMDNEGIGMAELAHEVLIRYWERFRAWLDADRAFRAWLGRLHMLIQQWEASGQDDGALLRGAPLAEAEKWAEERAIDLPSFAQTYVGASLRLRARQADQETRRQQREHSHTLALAAQLALANDDPGEALQLALDANQIDDPPPASRRILSEAAYAPGTRRLFRGHHAAVLDIAQHPDGERFLTASADGSVRLWHRAESRPLTCFEGHEAAVYCVACAPDGETAVSGDANGALIWWQIESGAILAQMEATEGSDLDRSDQRHIIHAVAFLPDGSGFLAAGDDPIVRLWSLPDAQLYHEYAGHRRAVHCLAISADGRRAASGGVDHDIFIWDLHNAKMSKLLRGVPNILPLQLSPPGHFATVEGMAFLPGDAGLIAADESAQIFQWDINAGAVERHITALHSSLRDIAVTADGRLAVVGTMDSQTIVLDLAAGSIVQRLKGHRGRVEAVTIATDGRTVLSASFDSEVRLWDLHYGAEARRQQFTFERDGGIGSFDLSPDGETGIFGFLTGDMAHWSSKRGEFTRRWHGHDDIIAGGCHFSADGTLAVSGSGDYYGEVIDSTVRVWDVNDGVELHCFSGHERHVRAVAFAPNRQFVLSAGMEGQLRRWSLRDEPDQILWDVAPQSVAAVAISPDSRWAVVGLGRGAHLNPDTAIHLFDLQRGARVRRFTGHPEGVTGLAFAPDGSFFLSTSFDNEVRLWDLSDGKCRHILNGHRGAPTHVAISPTGRLAVSGGADPAIILWDLEHGTALRRWHGHTGMIRSLNFTPDGRAVISTSLDHTLRMWRVDATQEVLLQWVQECRHTSEPLVPVVKK